MNWESLLTIVLSFASSAAFLRLWDLWVFRTEERRKRAAAAKQEEVKSRSGDANVDLLYAKGFGIQQEWYEKALEKSQSQVDKLLVRVDELDKKFEAEKRSHDRAERELEVKNSELRRRVHNLEIALVDAVFGITSLTKQMQEAGIEPRWRPMIKIDELVESMSHGPADAIQAAVQTPKGDADNANGE